MLAWIIYGRATEKRAGPVAGRALAAPLAGWFFRYIGVRRLYERRKT